MKYTTLGRTGLEVSRIALETEVLVVGGGSAGVAAGAAAALAAQGGYPPREVEVPALQRHLAGRLGACLASPPPSTASS
jgi:hypothetical protein